jgi:hypothetical protein
MVKTPGKVHQNPDAVRFTYQPGIGTVWRSSGVTRRSAKVLAQNDKFASVMRGKKIATACKDKKSRAAFFSCLRTEGKRAFGKA